MARRPSSKGRRDPFLSPYNPLPQGKGWQRLCLARLDSTGQGATQPGGDGTCADYSNSDLCQMDMLCQADAGLTILLGLEQPPPGMQQGYAREEEVQVLYVMPRSCSRERRQRG